jgi:Mg2+ and Co2+ transporter CorA
MVFTIVTIVFLPMSFIAAVFAINIQEFPKENGQMSLPWNYVAKFMCKRSPPSISRACCICPVFG